MNDAELNAFLESLGLTEYEAKTLSALFRHREAEAPNISRIAQVPKTRVYDVLDRLTKKGLIIEIYGRPKKYRTLEPKEAIEHLIGEKKKEISKLEERGNSLKKLLSGFEKIEADDGEKVMKVKDKKDFEKILAQEIDKAKNQVLAFTELLKEQETLKDAIKKARKNKVEVKMVSRIPKELRKIASEYASEGIELKHFEHGLNAFIIDKKRVVLALSDFNQEKPEYHFTIWNENPALATALKHYFDAVWGKAKNF